MPDPTVPTTLPTAAPTAAPTTEISTAPVVAPATVTTGGAATAPHRRPAGVEIAGYVVAAVLVVSGLVHLGIGLVDDRPWAGPLSWRKPTTFGLSFGLTLATVVWLSASLSLRASVRSSVVGLFTADCVVEVAGITLQAWRHVPSHFNTETTFDAAVAYTLAAGGGLLVALLGTLSVVALSGRLATTDPSMRLALRFGFGLLLAALGAGVAMIVRGTMLTRTGDFAAAYQQAGYLKPFHAVTLHAVLVLPMLALITARTGLGASARHRIVQLACAGYLLAAVGALLISLWDSL